MGNELAIKLTPELLAIMPLMSAALQLLKELPLPTVIRNHLPLVGIGIAVGLAYLAGVPDPAWSGVVMGLATCGGYKALKGVKNGKK